MKSLKACGVLEDTVSGATSVVSSSTGSLPPSAVPVEGSKCEGLSRLETESGFSGVLEERFSSELESEGNWSGEWSSSESETNM